MHWFVTSYVNCYSSKEDEEEHITSSNDSVDGKANLPSGTVIISNLYAFVTSYAVLSIKYFDILILFNDCGILNLNPNKNYS